MVVFGEYDDGSAYVELPVLQGLQIYTGKCTVVLDAESMWKVQTLSFNFQTLFVMTAWL